MTLPLSLRPLAMALAAAGLLACGSKSSDPTPYCERAPIPTTGPGDALGYFPADVGRSWIYAIEGTGLTGTIAVTGTQPAGSETAYVFTTTVSNGQPPTTELVVKRPAGVYVLSDPSVEPPLDALYPSLVLPFPVAVSPKALQVRCTNLDMGDLDGDGRADRGDLVAYVQVFSVTETAQVGAGSFVDVAHVQQLATVTVRASSAGTVAVDATQDDWYAKGVGRVLSLVQTFIGGALYASETHSLQSYAVPLLGGLEAPAAAPSQAGVGARPAPSIEARALGAARQVLSSR